VMMASEIATKLMSTVAVRIARLVLRGKLVSPPQTVVRISNAMDISVYWPPQRHLRRDELRRCWSH